MQVDKKVEKLSLDLKKLQVPNVGQPVPQSADAKAVVADKKVVDAKKKEEIKPTCTACKEFFALPGNNFCTGCTMVDGFPGKTMFQKKKWFIDQSVEEASKISTGLLPAGWMTEYVDKHVLKLLEISNVIPTKPFVILKTKPNLLALHDACLTLSSEHLAFVLSKTFIYGKDFWSTMDVIMLRPNYPKNDDSFPWMQLLASRVIDVWNIRHPIEREKSAMESLLACYFQNFREYAKVTPNTFKGLYGLWHSNFQQFYRHMSPESIKSLSTEVSLNADS